MTSPIRIAIDLMGGDFGLQVSLPATMQSLYQFPDLSVALVGDKSSIKQAIDPSAIEPISDRFTITHAADIVDMSEKPSIALRHKKQSSMRVALDLLHHDEVDAVVSAGNTGALMTIGHHVLKTLPSIERPAICAPLPAIDGNAYLLDLGANVDSSAQQLYQFGAMGAALCTAVDGVRKPTVALLNIGTENIKGNAQVQSAHQYFSEHLQPNALFNYVGFVEGNDLLQSKADVIVCDGFVGNIALKACEGVAGHTAQVIRQSFAVPMKNNRILNGLLGRVAARLVAPTLKRIYSILNHEQYNGAVFLGLQGVVIKSHGRSRSAGFQRAIAAAYLAVKHDMLKAISDVLPFT